MVRPIKLRDNIVFGANQPFVLIAGPCLIESEQLVMKTAEVIKKITERLHIPFIFKASFDKANRSSIYSERGPGMYKGLEILQKVKEQYNIPVTSDIHEASQAEVAGEFLDLIDRKST